jgi:predicted phosphodiesterase
MQIVSDLHLEFYNNSEVLEKSKLKISSDYLALLGDICVCGTNDIANMEKFLDYYSKKYKLIFWLPGNHEFYSGKKSYVTIDDILQRCKILCKKYKNVIFLNNKYCDIPINGTMYRMVGSTLWTYIPKDIEEYIEANMNDYNHIYVVGERYSGLISMEAPVRLKAADVSLMHLKSARYIYKHIKDSPYPLIILTHHKPFLDKVLDPKFDPKLYVGYETDQISRLKDKYKSKIKVWCYGHTHKHFNNEVDGVHFVSNPKGYPGQQTKFENDMTIKL